MGEAPWPSSFENEAAYEAFLAEAEASEPAELRALGLEVEGPMLRFHFPHAAGRLGRVKTARKAAAARENGKKGGRPRKQSA